MSSRSTICLAVMGLAAGVFGSGAVATLIEHAVGASHAAESRADVPHFNGPYAADLAQAWQESDSLFVRDVIGDGKVSEPEWAQLGARMSECLAHAGLDFGGYEDGGTYTVGPSSLSGDALSRLLDGCDVSTGGRWIHMLRTSMSTNPQNLPIDELMTECLIRNRAVSPDYTAEQFAEDNPAQTIPFLEGGTAIFWACNDEPLYTAKLHR